MKQNSSECPDGTLLPPAGTPSAAAAAFALKAAVAAAMVNNLGGVAHWSERGLSHHPEPAVKSQLLAYMGTAVAFLGDSFRAARCLKQSLSVAVSTRPIARMHPQSLVNLGTVYAHLGRIRSSALTLHLAASIWWRQGRHHEQITCHLNAARLLLLAGDRRSAAHDLAAAGALLPRYGSQDQVTCYRLATALDEYLADDDRAARETAVDLLEHAELDPGQRADLAWLLSLMAYRKGDRDAGRRCAELAYEQALTDWEPLGLQRITDLLNQGGEPGGASLLDIAGPPRQH